MSGRLVVIVVLTSAVAMMNAGGCACGDPLANANHTLEKLDILRGLGGVCVDVAGLGPEWEAYGLTNEGLEADVEQQLRQSGIKVVPRRELGTVPGRPGLLVVVEVVDTEEYDSPVVAVQIRLLLSEQALLTRDLSTVTLVGTWDTGVVAPVRREDLRLLPNDVEDYVAEFIEDYWAANPRDGVR
jgi:hypothetical protein